MQCREPKQFPNLYAQHLTQNRIYEIQTENELLDELLGQTQYRKYSGIWRYPNPDPE